MAFTASHSCDGCIRQWRQTSSGIKLSMFSLHSQDGAEKLWGAGNVEGGMLYGNTGSYRCRTLPREMGRWKRELQNGSFCIINKTWPIWIAVFVCQPNTISDIPLPLDVLLSFSFAMPAANAHPCKYAMTKIGNSCIRIHSKEGGKKQYVHRYWYETSNVHRGDAGETIARGTSSLKVYAFVFFLPCFHSPSQNLSFPFWFGNSMASSTRCCGCKNFHF